MNRLHRSVLTVALPLAALAVLASATPSQAQGNDFTYWTTLNPQAPRVGEYYTLSIKVRNNTGRGMIIRSAVTGVPQGDVLQSSAVQERYIGGGGEFTFYFSIYCGVEGGTVNYSVTGRYTN